MSLGVYFSSVLCSAVLDSTKISESIIICIVSYICISKGGVGVVCNLNNLLEEKPNFLFGIPSWWEFSLFCLVQISPITAV